MNTLSQQKLKKFIDQYFELSKKFLVEVDSKSLAKNKIALQNYCYDFSNFINEDLEKNEAQRYLTKLNYFKKMFNYYFCLPETPILKVYLMDDNENQQRPRFQKLVRTLEETDAFFNYELERIEESKIKFISLSNDTKVHDMKLLKKAFIVHGHDIATQQTTARFLERIGFEAIILSEQPSLGKTIIEKLEHYIDKDGFGVVLYTPDDEGSVKDKKDYKARARQNVVFEHGWLIGALGRNKVIQVVTDHNIELPNDISGVVYLSDKGWEVEFMKEISAMGYEIDYNVLRK